MYKALYAFPWDLVDEGLDTALERIRESGVNTITLAASQPAGRLPRPRGPHDRARSAAEGTVYFRARPERYGQIRLQADHVMSEFDVLAKLQRAAPDLRLAAWVAGCLDAPFGAQHPQCVSRNAFGDPYVHRLCPAHPAVRDYVVNLCSDLAHGYDLAAVVLDAPGWVPSDQGNDRDLASAPLDRWARALLALCFGETTRHAAKAAGIDADPLQAEVRELLGRYGTAEGGPPTGMAAACWFADLVSDPAWAAFLDWRCRQVADLVTEVKAALPAGTALAVIPTVPYHGALSRLEGCDLAMLARAADALEIPAYQASAEDAYLDAQEVRRRAGDDAALRFILRPGRPNQSDGEELADAVLELKQIGIAGIAFFAYEHIRMAGLAAVRAALRALEPA